MAKFQGILEDAIYMLNNRLILIISTNSNKLSQDNIILLKNAKNGVNVDISKFYNPRSINANNYSWKLQDEIAKKVGISIDEVHLNMIMSYGVIETYSILKEAFDSAVRIFDYYKILGESETNGKTFLHIRAGIGTHLYNTKEMARFIDGVVYEAQQLDIEIETPEKIAEMKSLWSEYDK